MAKGTVRAYGLLVDSGWELDSGWGAVGDNRCYNVAEVVPNFGAARSLRYWKKYLA